MTNPPASQPAPAVRRRHVFYISGFDPLGPSRYYTMYQEEAARQAAVSGMRIHVGPRRNVGRHSTLWQVDAEEAGVQVQTAYEALRWDDIVRLQWPRSRRAQVWQTFSTTWHYLKTGAFRRIGKLNPVGLWVLVMPTLLMAGLPLLALLTVVACVYAWGIAVGVAVGIATAGAATAVAWHLERQMQLAWLMRSFAFTRRYAAGDVPALDERLELFAQHIAQRVRQSGVDEIIVIGHSSGVKLAVSTVARAVKALVPGEDRPKAPALSLLTLGHSVLMLSALDEAHRFRADLCTTAMAEDWAWVDFTAPADGSCCALMDPTIGCDDVPGAAMNRPKVLSPRFASLFSAARYAALLRDRMRYHFQYLMAGEKPGAYDYFAITAGRMTLEARFRPWASVLGYRRPRRNGRQPRAAPL